MELIKLADKYNNKYFTFEDFFETLNQSKLTLLV